MRLINADKLYPDTFGKGRLAVSQSQIADALTVQAIPIPDNATNGDVLKIIFPNIEYGKSESKIYPNIFGWIENEEKTKDILMFQSNEEWWNEPYKGGE